ncbi:MAG: hypothetical protein IJK54_10515 [Clostridia bacterium]|nr:hypothetical protein [Clostridia bacterium]
MSSCSGGGKSTIHRVITITKDDVINTLDITENADDLYTAISVLGDDNVTIGAINPLGSNTIYDFSYYLDWMTPSLSAKVTAWQTAVEEAADPEPEGSYYNLNLEYYQKLAEASNIQAEIAQRVGHIEEKVNDTNQKVDAQAKAWVETEKRLQEKVDETANKPLKRTVDNVNSIKVAVITAICTALASGVVAAAIAFLSK